MESIHEQQYKQSKWDGSCAVDQVSKASQGANARHVRNLLEAQSMRTRWSQACRQSQANTFWHNTRVGCRRLVRLGVVVPWPHGVCWWGPPFVHLDFFWAVCSWCRSLRKLEATGTRPHGERRCRLLARACHRRRDVVLGPWSVGLLKDAVGKLRACKWNGAKFGVSSLHCDGHYGTCGGHCNEQADSTVDFTWVRRTPEREREVLIMTRAGTCDHIPNENPGDFFIVGSCDEVPAHKL